MVRAHTRVVKGRAQKVRRHSRKRGPKGRRAFQNLVTACKQADRRHYRTAALYGGAAAAEGAALAVWGVSGAIVAGAGLAAAFGIRAARRSARVAREARAYGPVRHEGSVVPLRRDRVRHRAAGIRHAVRTTGSRR